MRFFKNGPMIPDDLLIARDEGRVVFFCGAGVSKARADLPDFFDLAKKIICKLNVPTNNPACKILAEASEINTRTGVSGLISADRIFGLLERDFLVRDIEAAVAKALQPVEDVDLSAHQILLDLATLNFYGYEKNIVGLYPKQSLAISYAILPDNVADWPDYIEATLNRIGEADKNLKLDKRLIELTRKWNSR